MLTDVSITLFFLVFVRPICVVKLANVMTRFRFSFIEFVARRLKIKKAKQTLIHTVQQNNTIQYKK